MSPGRIQSFLLTAARSAPDISPLDDGVVRIVRHTHQNIRVKMENPTLELRNSNGAVLQANDNWMDSPNKQEIIDSGLSPTHNLESAIAAPLPANNARYTAIVRGVNDTTGIAVVEVYALN